jgi:hypothetical protein
VLLFAETSHWDPNGLLTSEQYYEQRIEQILDEVVQELQQEPRRVFSVEALFFFKLYWDRRPDRREVLRDLLDSGRLRMTGTGITTPDTVLPDAEAILRDYLHGQQWLQEQGLAAEPRLAYLPDNFGHSPALPSLLRAMGFTMTGMSRLDGGYFVGSDWSLPSRFPLEGSSAELLLEKHRSVDFVWQGPDGREVLCHFNPFTYFQGDMLAHEGIIRWMGKPLSFSWRTEGHVARRIRKYVSQLRPLSPTRYMFCPIGCDFNGPIHDLVGLLDRYNRVRYEHTGVWTALSTLEDYLTLVGQHRHLLPEMALDPNPYWMGFYSSRPEIKQQCNRAARKLTLVERLAAGYALQTAGHTPQTEGRTTQAEGRITQTEGRTTQTTGRSEDPEAAPAPDPSRLQALEDELRRAWDHVVVANHHDFITGTTPARVWEAEQRPWLAQMEALADGALEAVRRLDPTEPAPASPSEILSEGLEEPAELPEAEAEADQMLETARTLEAKVEPPPRSARSSPRRREIRPAQPPAWELEHGILRIRGQGYRAVLSGEQGGCLISYRLDDGSELLAGPANDLVAYRDSGGLWRMGHEYPGGRFTELARASDAPAEITAREGEDGLEVRVRCTLAGRNYERRLWFTARRRHPRLRVHGSAAKRITVTVRFPTTVVGDRLDMDVPGGVVTRPLRKLYHPTYWAARSTVHLRGRSPLRARTNAARGFAAFLSGPASAAALSPGTLEWVAFRNAPREKAWRVLPLLSHPARGANPDPHEFVYGIRFTGSAERGEREEHGESVHTGLLRQAELMLSRELTREVRDLEATAEQVLLSDREDVVITTVKPAERGEGLIARLLATAPPGTPVRLHSPLGPVRGATRCDALERDLEPLAVREGAVELSLSGALETVRLLP